MTTLADLVMRSRSVRRFDASALVPRETLVDLVELARVGPSAGNLQPLKYRLVHTKEEVDLVFPFLRWGGYIPEWKGPEPSERPPAYILLLRDNAISTSFLMDHGVAAQSMKLGAAERGLGTCIIGTLDRAAVRQALDLASELEILVVLAVGVPAETSVIETATGDDIRYWRDAEGVIHVPKRPLREILVG